MDAGYRCIVFHTKLVSMKIWGIFSIMVVLRNHTTSFPLLFECNILTSVKGHGHMIRRIQLESGNVALDRSLTIAVLDMRAKHIWNICPKNIKSLIIKRVIHLSELRIYRFFFSDLCQIVQFHLYIWICWNLVFYSSSSSFFSSFMKVKIKNNKNSKNTFEHLSLPKYVIHIYFGTF